MALPDLLAVARGDAPADLLLRGGRVCNVFTGTIESADVAVFDGRIAGVGPGYDANEVLDLDGAYLAPGLIDAHVHIESSLCVPAHFASAVLPRGVTTVVADPHEIANVCGPAGVRFIADSSKNLPLNVVVMAPSCVPATPMGTAGADLDDDALAELLADGTAHGLAEVMNFPGVISGDPAVLAKLASYAGRPLDGHAPGVTGKALNAYAASGVGSDHESVTVAEAREKLSRGLYVLIREATNARNLTDLLPLVTPANARRICLCTDDRQPADLLGDGGIDHMLRECIKFGLDPMLALRLCTLNTVEWFGLKDRGAIAPGRAADLFTFDDLQKLVADRVYAAGKLVAQNGTLAPGVRCEPTPADLRGGMNFDADALDFRIPAAGCKVRVIGSVEDQLVTEERLLEATVRDGHAVADPARDVLKMAVVERHRGTGNVGLGFIQGMGLKRGAIAGTVAHDHHNLVVIGADDASMGTAARAAKNLGGGLVAVEGDQVLATLALPVGGLMSESPIREVEQRYAALLAAAQRLGSPLHDPFMAMSFMALEVIPKLKLTDRGLVDVENFDFVDLFCN